MTIRIAVILCVLVGLAPAVAFADPIPNNSFDVYELGWFDAKERTCPQICEEHGAVAESEKNTAPPVDRAYVCKIRKAEEGPYWWLFGTQFGSRPACYTTDRNLQGEYTDVFYCLCVKHVGAGAGVTKKPDAGRVLRKVDPKATRIERKVLQPESGEIPPPR